MNDIVILVLFQRLELSLTAYICVNFTAVTADQCKVLMEGFSALCFRLQVANIAGGRGDNRQARPMPEEDGVSTTASATLTNNSTPRNR